MVLAAVVAAGSAAVAASGDHAPPDSPAKPTGAVIDSARPIANKVFTAASLGISGPARKARSPGERAFSLASGGAP